MAVAQTDSGPGMSTGRRMVVGTNVGVAIALAAGIVIVLQLLAWRSHARADMTSSGVNSISDGTEHLLRGLDTGVTLTSLYFETDREEEDQHRYRQAVDDLLSLYEATNRARVKKTWVNPLKDHADYKALAARLRDKPKYREQIAAYQVCVDRFLDPDGLYGRIAGLLQDEAARADGLSGSLGGGQVSALSGQVAEVLRRWSDEVERTRDTVAHAAGPGVETPQHAAAVNELKSVYRQFKEQLDAIARSGKAEVARNPSMPADEADFLGGAADRFKDVVASLEDALSAANELEPLDIDELLGQLDPTSNAIVVETDDDAVVVDFLSVWPPVQESRAARRVGFKDRAFKGEEKLTSAILRVTHKEQTAVVFVRYGGQPLFMGGFAPRQPAPPYRAIKQRLEEVNFVVKEWDLKTSDTPPDIDPKPTRTIYVVLKPSPPERGPFGQPSQEPPFGEPNRRAVLDAVGESGRALFVAGWMPGMFGAIPSTYEYVDYLKDEWGIEVDWERLIIRTISVEPGKYIPPQRPSFAVLVDVETSDHDIVHGAHARQVYLPFTSPLKLATDTPEGVEHARLLTQPKRDGVWAIQSLAPYQEQGQTQQYLTKVATDLEGPFDLAVAATKTKDDAEQKIVVVSARDFARDDIALANELSIGAQGLVVRSRNPGNITLLINSLHWLNDNVDFVNVGRPIDASVLEIENEASITLVRVLAMVVWPGLAAVCGVGVWWVRRR
ncbi:MAG: Gldg family protein [Phycisphaerae bacterium]